MPEGSLFSLHNRWFTSSVLITAGIAVVAAGFGFIWLPLMERNTSFPDVWTAICSAAGVTQPAPATGPIVEPAVKLTSVFLTQTTLPPLNDVAIGRGGTLALRCSMCHGARGLSMANSPNLAGQYATTIYKELQDFKSGARVSAIMSPFAKDLSDQDMRELAAYYAYLPRPSWTHGRPVPPLVATGAPMLGIAPCAACHGREAHKLGAPWLEGEPVAYLRAQLIAFKRGQRHGDINAVMRNVARPMTPEQIDAAARFYGASP